MSPRARQAKGKARVTAYERLLSQEYEQRREELEIYIPPGPRLGDIVIELEKVSKGLRRAPADRRPERQHPAGEHRGRDRTERGGQDDAAAA